MEINEYNFGAITVDGLAYNRDIIIFPDRIIPDWRRKRGHELELVDLEEVINFKPDILIIGTGKYGAMTVPEGTLRKLAELGIITEVCETEQACTVHNEKKGQRLKLVTALHLTC